MKAEQRPNYNQFSETTALFPRAEYAMLGEVPVVRAGWGHHATTEEMLSQWASPETPEATKDMIRNYGFSGGYSFEDGFDLGSPEAHDLNVAHMTALAQSALALRGWKEADLEVATISDRPEIVYEVRSGLEEAGIKVPRVRANGFACDGLGAAIIDTVADPSLQARPTVVVAAENLSGTPVPRSNITMSALFGNGGAALAFVPGQDISLAHPDLVWAGVKKDTKEVIKIPRTYDVNRLCDERGARLPPAHYEVWPGTEFFYGDDVAANQMTTGGGFGSMERETGAVFTEFLTPRAIKMLHQFQVLFPGEKVDLALLHQPSEQILLGIAKRIAKFGPRDYPGFQPPAHVPWLMRESGFNNISSGTIGVAMVEAARKKLIPPGQPVLFGTIGIGLSAHLGVVTFGSRD